MPRPANELARGRMSPCSCCRELNDRTESCSAPEWRGVRGSRAELTSKKGPCVETPKWLRRALDLPGATSFASLEPLADRAISLREELRDLSGADLIQRARTGDGAHEQVLALAAEASRRALGVVPFREQMLAAAAMLAGFAVELDTGEGKTLAGALAAAGFALKGRSVHVISVNDYLARRDAAWMGPLYAALGLSVKAVEESTATEQRRAAYRGDVVYVSVSEVGYDVLRDRFCIHEDDRVSPAMDVAIVDEADAVMIDEAIIPLVLAGTAAIPEGDVAQSASLVLDLEDGVDYLVDDDGATVTFTDKALDELESQLGGINLYSPENIPTLTGLTLALHAKVLMRRDVDYIVDGDDLRLVNTTRGRVAEGQRWPDGMHAAVEAKEGLTSSGAGIVLDQVTVQDLLVTYRTLLGMSGTVLDVSEDLLEFYSLRSGRVERRLPLARSDEPDIIVDTEADVFEAVVDVVQRCHEHARPVLVGTQSVAASEAIGKLLTARGLDVRVLNAKNDEAEAYTVSRAGELGAITISTQMSGRGTDIVLGGVDGADHEAVASVGGLMVIQVGLYPSRRLDAQLRGRAGRQGDPGGSLRIASLQDVLIATTATRTIASQIERPAGLTRKRKEYILDVAQDISEAVRADQHRATWGYHRAIALQRSAVLREREALISSDSTLWDRLGRVPRDEDDDDFTTAVREVAVSTLDDLWCDHLAMLQETRDGIHLRALGGQNPLDEFHRIALVAFDGFFERVYQAVDRLLFATGELDAQAAAAAARLRRPSATWTYMITDNPLGDAASRAAESLRTMWADRRRR